MARIVVGFFRIAAAPCHMFDEQLVTPYRRYTDGERIWSIRYITLSSHNSVL